MKLIPERAEAVRAAAELTKLGEEIIERYFPTAVYPPTTSWRLAKTLFIWKDINLNEKLACRGWFFPQGHSGQTYFLIEVSHIFQQCLGNPKRINWLKSILIHEICHITDNNSKRNAHGKLFLEEEARVRERVLPTDPTLAWWVQKDIRDYSECKRMSGARCKASITKLRKEERNIECQIVEESILRGLWYPTVGGYWSPMSESLGYPPIPKTNKRR